MKQICVDPTTDAVWRQLVQQQPGSVFHSPEWMGVIARTYHFELEGYILLEADGTPVAGLPVCRIDDIRGRRIVSLPFSDYCDPLVQDAQQWNLLVEALLHHDWTVVFRCLRNHLPDSDSRFTAVKKAKWHGIDLNATLDQIWERIDSSAKRAIRKAQQNGVRIIRAQHKDELHAFFEMHLAVRKHKYHMVAQPYSFFENIWETFLAPGHGALLLALHQNRIIGGTLYLIWQDTLYYKFNASIAQELGVRPNDLLAWAGLQYAKEAGCSRFDFGLSDWDQEGLIRFKRKFATDEQTITFYNSVPGGAASYTVQARELLPRLTDILTDPSVPDDITERAGTLLYRLFA